jgi:hypothetical protein
MSADTQDRAITRENVRWINDQLYIDSCREVHRYNKVERMQLLYTNMIIEFAADGLKDKQIQQAIRHNPNRAKRADISLTSIRETIRDTVYDVDEWTAMGYSEKRKEQCEQIMQTRSAGRPKNTTYDDEIARLASEGYNGHQIALLLRQQGCRISRATVYKKVNVLTGKSAT